MGFLNKIMVVTALSAALASCAQQEEPAAGAPASGGDAAAATPAPAVAASGFALAPVMGGVVRAVGQYIVELVARPDGRVEAQVWDAERRPVAEDAVTVTAEVGGGEAPIPVPLVREGDRYVGTVVGVEGPRPVSVVVEPEGQPEVEVAFPDVTLSAPEVVVEAPQHSGQVTVVGDNRVEVAAAPDGQVYVSVTDYQGVPLPPDVVTLHHVTVVTPAGPRVVVLEPQGAMFVGTLGIPPPPTFSVFFDLGVGPRIYHRVRFRTFHPLPPTAVVVVPPYFHHPGKGWHKGWGPYRAGPPVAHPGKGWGPAKAGRPGGGWAKGHHAGTPFGPPGQVRAVGHGGGPPGHVRGGGGGGGRGHGHGKRR
jgi:hypothetical protein